MASFKVGDNEVGCEDVRENSIPGRGNSLCKSPEMRASKASARAGKEARMATVQ